MALRDSVFVLPLCLGLWASPAAAQEARAPHVEVSGHAERETDFDRVRLGFRFASDGRDNAQVTKDVADRLAAGVKALEAEGFSGVETDGPRVQAKYAQVRDARGGVTVENTRIDGYEARGAIFLEIRDFAAVSKLATLMVGRGAAMDEPAYFLSTQDEAERELAAQAARDGVAQARRLIEAVGAKPGRILFIGDGGGAAPRPMDFALRKASAPALDIPVRPGKARLARSVVVRVEILTP